MTIFFVSAALVTASLLRLCRSSAVRVLSVRAR